ncbi:Protein of unknown function (DUF630 and DUF632) [Quillaja saponaria]|uniref:Uncharacterized protein n=1 Tax=Quillaja saponaria TaxID=32244 RepID=A0AAD7LH92_QUISA|nr:Protein of unknown function (DUF630 and DUF632) [Quillaja saponaria]
MGIGVSKSDSSQLVNLCKERKESIKGAKHCRYDLVSANVFYFQSLLDVGNALNRYVEEEFVIIDGSPQDSTSDIEAFEEDSYLKFPSSDSDLESLFDHVPNDAEERRGPLDDLEVSGSTKTCIKENQHQSTVDVDIKYMKTSRYDEIHCEIHEQIQGQQSSNLSYMYSHGPSDSTHDHLRHPEYSHGLSSGGDEETFGVPMGMPHGDLKFQEHINMKTDPVTVAPSPPKVSAWDSFNPFITTYDAYYNNYLQDWNETKSFTNDHDCGEIREREGIPDLEDEFEKTPAETVSEKMETKGWITRDTVGGTSYSAQSDSYEDALSADDKELEDEVNITEEESKGIRDNNVSNNLEEELAAREAAREGAKEGAHFEAEQTIAQESESLRSSSVSTLDASKMGLHEAVKYIRDEFENAFHYRKEVSEEEKLRALYDKEWNKLKTLDRIGAESDRIDNTLASSRRLNSEINVAVAAADVISRRIHKLRDEELLPQLIELIEGLIGMWKFMGSCHQKQLQVIKRAKSHVHIVDPGIRKESSSRATLRLEKMILNWGMCFSNFIDTQKAFVKYLDEWLLRCISQEPEETSDGTAPFSPSRIGAPPIFTVCNDWYHAVNGISGMEVCKAINDFASNVHRLYEKQEAEKLERHKVEYFWKDFIYGLQSFHKNNGISWDPDALSDNMEALWGPTEAELELLGGFDEILVPVRKRLIEQKARHEDAIREVNDASSSCLQAGLCPVFEALEGFCLETLNAYEQLRVPNTGVGVQ